MTAKPTYIVAGSFNPFHLGHKFLIDSALQHSHSKVVVMQARNPHKELPANTIGVLRDLYEERVELEVLPPHTLMAEFCVGNYENPILVRGYRDDNDKDYERGLEKVNRAMGLNTLLLSSPAELHFCSSSLIRGITGPGNVGFHHQVQPMMPKAAYVAYLENWIAGHLSKVGLSISSLPEVLARYRESHRHYHNLCHIVHTLQELARLRADGMIISNEVDLQLLFHDAVYDSTKTDNEALSVRFMQECIGPHDGKLIMATAGHKPVGRLEEIMVACDLAILGRPAAEYKRYSRGIRKEYSWVGDETYRVERLKILYKMIGYRFPDYWPDPAYNARLVDNLNWEIHGLNTNALLPDFMHARVVHAGR